MNDENNPDLGAINNLANTLDNGGGGVVTGGAVSLTTEQAVIELINHLHKIRFYGHTIDLPSGLKSLAGIQS